MSKKLTFQEVLCPICSSILIEPVSLPCKHTICKLCLEKSVDNNTLTCPICRKRIGSFLRSKRASSKLIDQGLWNEMKEQFETEIKMKQNRKMNCTVEKLNLLGGSSGKKEYLKIKYEEFLEKLKSDKDKLGLTNETKRILPQQFMRRNFSNDKQRKNCGIPPKDIILIQSFLLTEKNKNQPNILNTNLKERNEILENCGGRDSIEAELRHFTPIAVVPRTPPKRLPNGKVQETKLLRPKNIAVKLDKADISELRLESVQGSLRVTSKNFVPTRIDEDSERSGSAESSDERRSQERQEQEKSDYELALKVQNEWNNDTSRDGKRAHNYMLRSAKKHRR